MTPEQALEKAETVYQRLLAQGRSESDSRRDAERWVKGNFALDVTLPAPEGLRYGPATVTIEDVIAAREAAFTSATESYSHFASAAATTSEAFGDLVRELERNAARAKSRHRADIFRLEEERDLTGRQAREAMRDGFEATAAALWDAVADLNRRIEWYREQMRNA